MRSKVVFELSQGAADDSLHGQLLLFRRSAALLVLSAVLMIGLEMTPGLSLSAFADLAAGSDMCVHSRRQVRQNPLCAIEKRLIVVCEGPRRCRSSHAVGYVWCWVLLHGWQRH